MPSEAVKIKPSLRDSFTEVLHRVGREDQNLVVLVGDISHFRLQPFARECPGRYYNVGICEPTIVNVAAGLSKVGFHPVVHTISPFIVERSFEQLKLDFGYQDLGGNIVTVGSAFDYANLGCTHHCYGDFALLKTLPGSQLFYPASHEEFEALFRQVYNKRCLNYFRIPAYGHTRDFSVDEIVFGQALKLEDGKDMTLIAVGSQLRSAEEALPILKSRGISVELIYIHTVKPLDERAILASVTKTLKFLVIEEHSVFGGVFDDVLRTVRHIDSVRSVSLSIPNAFIREYGTYQEHCDRLGLSAKGIIDKTVQLLKV